MPIYSHLIKKAKNIQFLLTDVDGVLTDTGVYYSERGEELKRFSIRDGMGVERLRTILNIETGIITGENSGSVIKRAEKLQIRELYLGIKNKEVLFQDILAKKNLSAENVAYIGDDYNDIGIMKLAGLTAAPADGMPAVKNIADYICTENGGYGAFRDFVELIIRLRSN